MSTLRKLITYLLIRRVKRRKALEYVAAQYTVTPPAEKMHRCPAKFRALRGPNQAGKTIAGAREVVYRLLGYHPYLEVPAAPVEGKIVTYSFSQGLKAQKAIYRMIPPWELDPDCHFDPDLGFRNDIVRLRNGSSCTVQTDKQGTLAHSSDTLDFVWFDEPPSQGKYGENQARIAVRNGVIWITFTPIGRPVTWLKDEVEIGKIADIHFRLTPEDVPFISPERIQEIRDSYLEEERDQRADGAWEGVSPNRKFTQFRPAIHIINDDKIPDVELRLYIGNDHGEKANNEYFLIVGIYSKEGSHYAIALAEYTGKKGAHPNQDAEGVQSALAEIGCTLLDVTYSKADTNSSGKLGAGKSINDMLELAYAKVAKQEHPPFSVLKPDKRPGSVIGGTRRINNALKEGKLLVHERCKQFITSLRYWDGEDNEHKHAIDAARYILTDFLKDTSLQPANLRIE